MTTDDIDVIRNKPDEQGIFLTNQDNPQYYKYESDDGQSKLGIKIPKEIFGITCSYENILTDINITNKGEGESLRWQTDNYQMVLNRQIMNKYKLYK